MAIKCKTLLGTKNLDFSLACLQSFINNSEDEIHLQIFEDGSLTDHDVHRLLTTLKGSTVIKKSDRDSVINEKLKQYPQCYKYRNSILYAHKIFDVALYDDHDLLFIDSDVLFLKKFKLPAFNNTPVFIADKHHAYSFTPVEFFNVKFPIFPHVNTGFFYFPHDLFSVEFVEQLLTDPIIGKGMGRISWLEQTIWGFLAARNNQTAYFDSSQIIMARKTLRVDANTIAIHLVSSYRNHFEGLKSKVIADTEKYEDVRLKNVTAYLSKTEFAVNRIKKKAYRHLHLEM